ncbi:MAG TPA: DUF4230 domain-containing protein [Thermoanaerobaculia bacterium]|nr:DUF4230 domain-containing protein [Thermoanaerobaculia bacterium]
MRRNVLIAIGIGLVVGVIAIVSLLLAWRIAKRTFETNLTIPKEEVIDVGAVVSQVRSLNRLETASMRVIHVSTLKQSYTLVPNAMAGDEITLMAAGDVVAGVDLSQLAKDDVWREGEGTIVMRLPSAQIFMTRVDNRETKVVSRKTGVLRRADPGLESRARQLAEQGIRSEALKRGIITLAKQNAELRLAELLQKTGVRKVRFEERGRVISDQ